MRPSRTTTLIGRASGLVLALACSSSIQATPPSEGFPVARPASRLQAVTVLSGGAPEPHACLTPLVQAVRSESVKASAPARRAFAVLASDNPLLGERRAVAADGTVVRYTAERASLDRIDPADDDGNGRPDLVDVVLAGIQDARSLLRGRLELGVSSPVEIVLGRLGSGIDGLTLPDPDGDGRLVIVLESVPRGGNASLRRAAAHQFGHAAAGSLGPGLPATWAEALATWVEIELGDENERSLAPIVHRLERLADGLDADDIVAAAGNAAWLAFLDEAYGPTSVRLSLDEIATGAPIEAALDRALQRAAAMRLRDAFRDFHLWSVLVGDRADGRHFPFAARIPGPRFASSWTGLPALSILSEPPVAGLGAAHAVVRLDEAQGGVTFRFEGELSTRWDADLLLLTKEGRLHRVAILVGADGRGEATVPLDGIREVLLLVRNLGSDGGAPRRYTWSAFRVPGYPFELASLSATRSTASDAPVLVSWETISETGVIGYNVWRLPADGGSPTRINPVWVPAVGDRVTASLYRFVDGGADPAKPVSYAIEGVTRDGLSSRSDPVPVTDDDR